MLGHSKTNCNELSRRGGAQQPRNPAVTDYRRRETMYDTARRTAHGDRLANGENGAVLNIVKVDAYYYGPLSDSKM